MLASSHLPNDDLALIWELADADDDGMLSEPEFCVAMHLVFCRHRGELTPSELPPPLQQLLGSGPRAAQPGGAQRPGAAERPGGASGLRAHFGAAVLASCSVPFGACAAAASGAAADPWEMKGADRAKYSDVFLKARLQRPCVLGACDPVCQRLQS